MRKYKGNIEVQPEEEDFDCAIASDTDREFPTELVKKIANIQDRLYVCEERDCEKLPGFTYVGGLLRH